MKRKLYVFFAALLLVGILAACGAKNDASFKNASGGDSWFYASTGDAWYYASDGDAWYYASAANARR